MLSYVLFLGILSPCSPSHPMEKYFVHLYNINTASISRVVRCGTSHGYVLWCVARVCGVWGVARVCGVWYVARVCGV